jgi:hypothetical protein
MISSFTDIDLGSFMRKSKKTGRWFGIYRPPKPLPIFFFLSFHFSNYCFGFTVKTAFKLLLNKDLHTPIDAYFAFGDFRKSLVLNNNQTKSLKNNYR